MLLMMSVSGSLQGTPQDCTGSKHKYLPAPVARLWSTKLESLRLGSWVILLVIVLFEVNHMALEKSHEDLVVKPVKDMALNERPEIGPFVIS